MTAGTEQPTALGRKGTETRARLLGAARLTFEESDFSVVRVADIAARAGVSHGLFYRYFTSKDDVFRALATEVLDDLLTIDPVRPTDETADHQLLRGIRTFLEGYRRDSALMLAVETVARFDPETERLRSAIWRERVAQVVTTIEQLQAEGGADRRLDPRVAALAVSATMWRFAEAWLVKGDLELDFDSGVEQIHLFVANALRGPA